ncbi:MAG: hypothetical protein RMK30_09770 [Anaerolineae bacterium]|nr:hypothetical protein [Anaerolineae bacterium]MDW8103151.1 hypothetical protein [Anaerolineae bacterium]
MTFILHTRAFVKKNKLRFGHKMGGKIVLLLDEFSGFKGVFIAS